MPNLLKQSSTGQPLIFLLVSSTDHIAGVTGLTPTVTISKAGGSFASPSGAISEVANGWYKVAGNATDTGTLGPLILHATGTGADPVDIVFEVVAFDPLTTGAGGIPVVGTGANNFKSDSSAQVTAASVQGNVTGSVASVSGNVGGNVTGSVGSVTGNVGGNVVGSVASVTAGVTVTTNNDKTGYTVSTVSDKTGYSLTQAFPTNFSALAITAGGIAQADVQTIKTQAVTASAGVTFPASIASPTNITAGTITTVTNLTNAPTSGDFTATMKTSLDAATPAVTVSDKTGFALTSAYDAAKTAAQAGDAMALTTSERTSVAAAIWNALTSGLTTAGSIGKRLVDFVTTLVYAAAPSASDNATAVWASGTRTLTSSASLTDDQAQTMADLAVMIQGSDTADAQFTTKALEEGPSGTGATPSEFWTYATRTLTSPTITIANRQTGNMNLAQGASYLASSSTEIGIHKAVNATGWPDDLTGMTITMDVGPNARVTSQASIIAALGTGEILTAIGVDQAVSIDITSAASSALVPGVNNYVYDIWATKTGEAYLLESGLLTVTDDVRS